MAFQRSGGCRRDKYRPEHHERPTHECGLVCGRSHQQHGVGYQRRGGVDCVGAADRIGPTAKPDQCPGDNRDIQRQRERNRAVQLSVAIQ